MTIPSLIELEQMAKDDPWIDYFLRKQLNLRKEMDTAELIHMAQSFGSPVTDGAQMFKIARRASDSIYYQFICYCMVKGIVEPRDYEELFAGDPPK